MNAGTIASFSMGDKQRRETDTPYSQLLFCVQLGTALTVGLFIGYWMSGPSMVDIQNRLWAFGGGMVSSGVLVFGLVAPLLANLKAASEAKIQSLQDRISEQEGEITELRNLVTGFERTMRSVGANRER